MATKASVETKITAINDNGNNTAVEVRDVLTELLNFSDEGLTGTSTRVTNVEAVNVTQNTNIQAIVNNRLKPFHFWNPDFIRNRNGNLLWYSFKGIENQFVNFTFRISIKKISKKGYLFVPKPKELEQIFKSLSNIIDSKNNHNQMDFLIKIKNFDENGNVKKGFRIGSMRFTFSKEGLNFEFECSNIDEKIVGNDEICSSITFHCPDFKFED